MESKEDIERRLKEKVQEVFKFVNSYVPNITDMHKYENYYYNRVQKLSPTVVY